MNSIGRSFTAMLCALIICACGAQSVFAAPGDANRKLVERFMTDIWSKGDMKAIDDIIADDFQFILSFTNTTDREGFRTMVKKNRESFENLTYTPLDIIVDGDKATCRWRMTSKHVGMWRDIPGTNKDVSIEGITFFELEKGKFKRAWVQNDVMGLMAQIGGIESVPPKLKNIELVKAYVNDILIKRDFSTFSKYAAPNFHIDRSAVPEGITGKEGLNAQMDMLYKAFPDMELKMADIVAQGDKVLVRFEGPGTQTGEFAGIPPTGIKATWKGLVLYQIKDGKLVHAWATWDDYGLLMQLKK